MTRGLAGVGFALLGLLPLGVGILLLTGAWRQSRGILRLGLGVFTGIAGAIAVLPPLLYAGLSPSIPVVLVLGGSMLVLGLLIDSRRKPRRAGPEHRSVRLELLPAFVIAIPLCLLAVVGVQKPVNRYDAFANWALKAKLLFYDGTFTGALDDRLFASGSVAPPVHREYPIGLPAVEAYVLHGIGGENLRVAHLLFVVFFGGLALFVWAFLRPWVSAWPLAAGLSFLLWMPRARSQGLSDYADVPLACFFAVAALLIGLWLAGEGDDRLALGSVFAAASLATKREAIAFCAVLFVLAVVALLVRGERNRLRPLLLAGLAVAASTVPWRVFVAANGLEEGDVDLSLARVRAQADELPFVLGQFGHLFFESGYLGAVPLAALAALLLLARGRDRQLAVGVLALGMGLIAALAFVYVTGDASVHYLVRASAHRTLMTPTLLAAVLLPLLVTRGLGPGGSREGT